MSEEEGTPNLESDFFFGWDLLYKIVEPAVNKTSDPLIVLAHFVLIKHYKLLCLGLGENRTLGDDEVGSELLPDGWNASNTNYALRYKRDNVLYILLGNITADTLIINLMTADNSKVSKIVLTPCEHIKRTKGRIYEVIPTASNLVASIRKELCDKVLVGSSKDTTTQTTAQAMEPNRPRNYDMGAMNSEPALRTPLNTGEPLRMQDPFRVIDPMPRDDPLRIGNPIRPMGQFMPFATEPQPLRLPNVGRGDLDPLGRGGPGNLFEFPPRPNFSGGIRPRFDPYGPPDPNAANPNPDHLQPPNYGGHNYFM